MSEKSVFEEDSAVDYDVVVDWESRLSREAPFFRALFERANVRRVADIGCGTGMHAIMFASWGLEVTGVDPSEAMLEQARANAAKAGADVQFLLGGYGELSTILGASADAVVSLGNALQHVEGADGMRAAARDMFAVTRPGGVLALHFLNHDRLVDNRIRMLPARLRETESGDRVFLKILDYDDGELGFEMVTLERDGEGWGVSSRRSRHEILRVAAVTDALAEAGYGSIELLGGHDGTPFDIAVHESVLIAAERA